MTLVRSLPSLHEPSEAPLHLNWNQWLKKRQHVVTLKAPQSQPELFHSALHQWEPQSTEPIAPREDSSEPIRDLNSDGSQLVVMKAQLFRGLEARPPSPEEYLEVWLEQEREQEGTESSSRQDSVADERSVRWEGKVKADRNLRQNTKSQREDLSKGTGKKRRLLWKGVEKEKEGITGDFKTCIKRDEEREEGGIAGHQRKYRDGAVLLRGMLCGDTNTGVEGGGVQLSLGKCQSVEIQTARKLLGISRLLCSLTGPAQIHRKLNSTSCRRPHRRTVLQISVLNG